MCALTLCLQALMRWQRDHWPESGVLGLNLRSVMETFQQPKDFSFPKMSSTFKSQWMSLLPALPGWVLEGR